MWTVILQLTKLAAEIEMSSKNQNSDKKIGKDKIGLLKILCT